MSELTVGRGSMAMSHLEKLVAPDHVYCCACVFCGESNGMDGDKGHEPDCEWLAAKKFVEHIKAIDSLGEIPIMSSEAPH